jgi:DNA-binding XRE family transcriptional regulator
MNPLFKRVFGDERVLREWLGHLVTGIHRQTIAQLETGVRQPTWETVQALARALGVDCKAFETQPAEAETPAK